MPWAWAHCTQPLNCFVFVQRGQRGLVKPCETGQKHVKPLEAGTPVKVSGFSKREIETLRALPGVWDAGPGQWNATCHFPVQPARSATEIVQGGGFVKATPSHGNML